MVLSRLLCLEKAISSLSTEDGNFPPKQYFHVQKFIMCQAIDKK